MMERILCGWVLHQDAIGFWREHPDLLVEQPEPLAKIGGVARMVDRSDPLALLRGLMHWWRTHREQLPEGSGDALLNFLSQWGAFK